MPLSLADIRQAQARIAGAICVSPCPESPALSELTGCRVFCKLDYLQRTGSFKERGARNAAALARCRPAATGRHRGFGRQPCAGASVPRAGSGHPGDGRHAAVCSADQGGDVPAVRGQCRAARRRLCAGQEPSRRTGRPAGADVHPRLRRSGRHRRPGNHRPGTARPGAKPGRGDRAHRRGGADRGRIAGDQVAAARACR